MILQKIILNIRDDHWNHIQITLLIWIAIKIVFLKILNQEMRNNESYHSHRSCSS